MATHTVYNAAQVVTIGGLGYRTPPDTALTTLLNPIPLAVAPGTQPASTRFGPYVAAVNLVDGIPQIQNSNQGISPITGDPVQGTFNIELVIAQSYGPTTDDVTANAMADLAAFFAPAQPKPVAYASATFGPNDTVIQCRPGDVASSGIVADSIIYWGREAFRVESVDAIASTITIYDWIPQAIDSDLFVPRSTNGAEGALGHLGTYISTHTVSPPGSLPPYDDSRIWLVNPFVKDREVCTYLAVQGQATEQLWGAYWLLDDVAFQLDGAVVGLSGGDVMALLSEQQVNRNVAAYKMSFATGTRGGVGFQSDGALLAGTWSWSTMPGAGYIRNTGGGIIAVRGRPAYVTLTAVAGGDYTVGTATMQVSYGAALDAFATQGADSGGGGDDAAYEVLATNPNFYADPTTSPYYDPDAAEIAQHPMDLLRQHLGTKPSQLPTQWIAQIPPSLVDDAALVRLRNTVYQGMTWRGVLKVCDGESESLLEFLTATFCRPLFASLTTDASCRLTVRSLLDTAGGQVSEVNGAHVMQGRGVAFSSSVAVDQFRAATAINVAGDPALQFFGAGAYLSAFIVGAKANIVDWDAQGLVSLADLVSVGTAITYSTTVQSQAERMARVAALFRGRPQFVDLTVTMGAGLVSGQLRLFRIRGLRDPSTGQYPPIDDAPTLREGLVVSVANDPRYGTASVQVVLFSAITPRVGPSAKALGTDPDTIYTSADTYVRPVPYQYAPDAGLQVSVDVDTFVVGDVIILRDNHLKQVTNPTTIASISGVTLTVSPSLTAIGTATPYTPQVGDVVTYPPFVDATQAQLADFAFFDRSQFGL